MQTTTNQAKPARLTNLESLTPERLLDKYHGQHGYWRVKTRPRIMDGELRSFWTDKFYEGKFEDVLDMAIVELGVRFLYNGVCGEIRPFNLKKLEEG